MTSPHDALVKSAFSQIEHATGLLRQVLSPELAARVDFTTLALCPGSFVDEALRERHTDLLFAAKIAGHEARIYLLFEHKSQVEALLPLQLLRYLLRAWEAWLVEHPQAKRIPVIVPVVLHHSKSGWTAATSFESPFMPHPLRWTTSFP